MKKRNVLIATLLVAATAMVAVVSRKKEKHDQNANDSELIVQTADNMDEYLMTFKKKLLSAEKGGETISLEQAERDLGNLLNFDFGDANYATDVFQADTMHANLTLTGDGQVDLSQLAVTYNNAIDEILKAYHNVNIPEKSIYAISCKFNETESKDGEAENVEIVVITRGFMGLPLDLMDTLDWRPKNRAGSCDGQYVNIYGAPEIIRKWIMKSQVHMDCLYGGRVYYTEVDHWNIDGHHTYDPTTNSFLIYTSFEPNQNAVCIPFNDMIWYYHNILSLWNQQGYTSHEILNIIIEHKYYMHGYVNGQYYYSWATWHITIRHGKPNCTETDPLV